MSEEISIYDLGSGAIGILEAEIVRLQAELALARAVVDAARNSYDVNDYPAEEGDLYKAIAAYDAAMKAKQA